VETWVNTAGTAGFTGDGGAATSAQLSSPEGLLIHPDGGLLLIVDRANHRIRTVDLATRIITTWAGTGSPGFTGDGLDKLAATFNMPIGIAALPDGDVLVVQHAGCRVIRITPAGIVRPFAASGTCTSTGDGGSALTATVNNPAGVAVANNTGEVIVYVADWGGRRVSCQGWGGGGGLAAPVVVCQRVRLSARLPPPHPAVAGAGGAVGA
jgi:hypothetical protein